MTTMPTTGKNEESIIEAEGASQSLLQGQGRFHEGQSYLSMARLQSQGNRLPSLTGKGWNPDFR